MYRYVVTSLRSAFVAACQLGRHVSERQPGIRFSDSIPEAVESMIAEYARFKMFDFDPLKFMVTPENYAVITFLDGYVVSMVRLDHYLENGGSIGELNHE